MLWCQNDEKEIKMKQNNSKRKLGKQSERKNQHNDDDRDRVRRFLVLFFHRTVRIYSNILNEWMHLKRYHFIISIALYSCLPQRGEKIGRHRRRCCCCATKGNIFYSLRLRRRKKIEQSDFFSRYISFSFSFVRDLSDLWSVETSE